MNFLQSVLVNGLAAAGLFSIFIVFRQRIWPSRSKPSSDSKRWEAQRDLVLEVARIGSWDWCTVSGKVEWNEQHFRLMGLEPGTVQPSYTLWRSGIHPDDVNRVEAAVNKSLTQGSDYAEEYRVLLPDGSVRWMLAKGRGLRNEQGQISRMVGVVFDITDRKQADESLRQSESVKQQILKAIPDLLLWMKADGTCVGFSQGQDITNLFPDPDHPLGVNQYDLLPPDLAAARRQAVEQGLATGAIQIYEQELTLGARTQYEEVRVVPVDSDQVLVIIRDISQQKLIEMQRQQTEKALRESERRYRKVVEAQTDFVLRSQPDTTITFANPALCRALGVTLEEIIGQKWTKFANVDDLEQSAFRSLYQLTPENPRFFAENRDTRAGEAVGWTQWLNEGIFDEQGQLLEIQSVGRDITALKRAEQAVRESEERLRLVTENMSDLVCLHQLDGRYIYVTASSQQLLGYRPEELIGQDSYAMVHPEDRARIQRRLHRQMLAGRQQEITYRIRQKSGSYIWLESIVKPILDSAGNPTHLLTTSRDITDRITFENQLRHDALHDALTGLPNRTLLMEQLSFAIKQIKREQTFQFAVLFLDLDQFKLINDSLGHLVGDQLLIAVAQRLLDLTRETDLVARISGDEFVILLEDITSFHDAVYVAQRILEEFQHPLSLDNREVFITPSIGIAAGSADYQQPAELVRDADIAMYRAKKNGRAHYAIFDPTMHLEVFQRLHIENDLRKALENQEFQLYYQPIVSLKTLKVQGFEALLRWQHPRQGLLGPEQFITVAEETGFIVPIGEWVLKTACQQLATWQHRLQASHLKISINLSVKQLKASILLPQLRQVLQATRLPGSAVTLEITESMLVQNMKTACHLLNQIHAQGSQVSIDDFGTGYSSLSYLHQLPVDALKIDRTFVSQIQADPKNQTIAESIVALSNLLELDAIAEGIETVQQLRWLQDLDCELGQGYLFSPPVPAAEAQNLLSGVLQVHS